MLCIYWLSLGAKDYRRNDIIYMYVVILFRIAFCLMSYIRYVVYGYV